MESLVCRSLPRSIFSFCIIFFLLQSLLSSILLSSCLPSFYSSPILLFHLTIISLLPSHLFFPPILIPFLSQLFHLLPYFISPFSHILFSHTCISPSCLILCSHLSSPFNSLHLLLSPLVSSYPLPFYPLISIPFPFTLLVSSAVLSNYFIFYILFLLIPFLCSSYASSLFFLQSDTRGNCS